MLRCLLFGHSDGAPVYFNGSLVVNRAECKRMSNGAAVQAAQPRVTREGDPRRKDMSLMELLARTERRTA